MIRKTLLLTLALAGVAATGMHAQEISKMPVSDETVVRERLFELDTLDINYYFRANLPTNNFLIMEFSKMSYWPAQGSITRMFNTAKDVVATVRDSFASPGTSKRIDIHMPVKDEPLSVRIFEHRENGSTLVIHNGNTAPLKLGMDTIRILKTYAETSSKKKKQLAQVQYTFILKDLDEINTLANHVITDSVEKTFNDLVAKKRGRWSNQDGWYHSMDAVYDPQATEEKKKLQVETSAGFLEGLDMDANIGLSLFRSTVAPTLEAGFSYRWLSNNRDYTFVGMSLSSIYFFEDPTQTSLGYDILSFLNLEWGTQFTKRNSRIPLYKTSMGIGVKVSQNAGNTTIPAATGFDVTAYRVFFKYSLSKSITVIPEFYRFNTTEAGRDQNTLFLGLSVVFKFW